MAEALTLVVKTGEGWWEAELHRLRGELLLAVSAGNHHEAESCFCQALTIAHQQQAKSLELRTAMSLSRLWLHQGKRAEAHQLLAPIYAWFTEGFDTADLQKAKALPPPIPHPTPAQSIRSLGNLQFAVRLHPVDDEGDQERCIQSLCNSTLL